MRDAQGNVLATYERSFAKILDFQNITYAKINDTLVKYTGLSGLAEFSAQYSNFSQVRNQYLTSFSNDTNLLNSIGPFPFIISENYTYLDTLVNRLTDEQFIDYVFTNWEFNWEEFCRCFQSRSENNSEFEPLLLSFVQDEQSLELFLGSFIETGQADKVVALAQRLDRGDLSYEDAITEIKNFVLINEFNLGKQRIFSELRALGSFDDCGQDASDFLRNLYSNNPERFKALLVKVPGFRAILYNQNQVNEFSCSISFDAANLSQHFNQQTPANLWRPLVEAYGTEFLLNYHAQNMSSYFVNTAVNFAPNLLATVQSANNLYGGNYGGLENYFSYIRNYFGQGLYDQITAGFMQQSSVYTDSLRLEEWHLYGSSRIGIYQTNKAMAQRTVRIENGVTTQLSNTHIEQLSLSRFYTERGAKRYELTNHLGNVLTVVTDKKLPVCSGTSVSYFIADIVSATDYSPGGAPLVGRSYTAPNNYYRFGFNKGSEKDDEISGNGNYFTTLYREGDTRLLVWWGVDPETEKQPYQSPYAYMDGNSIKNNDPDGDIVPQLIGAGWAIFQEVGIQVTVNVLSGKRGSEILDLDYGDIAIEAGVGFATAGIGNIAKLGKTAIRITNAIKTTEKVVETNKILKVVSKAGTKNIVKAAVDVKYDSKKGIIDKKIIGGDKKITEAAVDLVGSVAGDAGTKVLGSLVNRGYTKVIANASKKTAKVVKEQVKGNVKATEVYSSIGSGVVAEKNK